VDCAAAHVQSLHCCRFGWRCGIDCIDDTIHGRTDDYGSLTNTTHGRLDPRSCTCAVMQACTNAVCTTLPGWPVNHTWRYVS
jgi:hypothetical protein